jgi:4-aminobutyrate aminotransferase/(S)-3-amino-2-methylpropionate transaminase
LFPGGGPARAVLGSSGSDAVETALKTALLATGRPGVLAFAGGYHGLAFGSLDTTHRADFRDPFASRLAGRTVFARFGDLDDVRRQADAASAAGDEIGAVLVEPIQGRGGERIPPDGFLRALRALSSERGWLLIADEIYTGFGRTGRWFACEHEDVTPDLLCVGKGLSSGMPISACLGRAEVMDAWPASAGEALHTQTFLGHPAGCAAALASIAAIEDEGLVARADALGRKSLTRLAKQLAGAPRVVDVRGRGLMIGVEYADGETALQICRGALERGVIVLPSGDRGEVVSITPPLSIAEAALGHGLDVLQELSLTGSGSESGSESKEQRP